MVAEHKIVVGTVFSNEAYLIRILAESAFHCSADSGSA